MNQNEDFTATGRLLSRTYRLKARKIENTYNKATGIYNTQEGIEYIMGELLKGNSVIAGVAYDDKSTNHNKSTNHFINIVGMGFESTDGGLKNYFSYYDNASKEGTNLSKNRLYNGSQTINNIVRRVIFDNTYLCVLGAQYYYLSEIRRNK